MTLQHIENLKNRELALKQERKNKEEIYTILQSENFFNDWITLTIDIVWDKLDYDASYGELKDKYSSYNYLVALTNKFDPIISEQKGQGKTKSETYSVIQVNEEFNKWTEELSYIIFGVLDGVSPRVLHETYDTYQNIHPFILLQLTGGFNLVTPLTVLSYESLVNSYTARFQGRPEIAITSTGRIAVVWHSNYEDSLKGVYCQMFDTNLKHEGIQFQVNTYESGLQTHPWIDCNINCFIAWSSDNQDGSNRGIFGQIVDQDGNFIGSELAINTYTQNTQHYPTVYNLGEGWVVTWSSLRQDSSAWGVFGQIFDSSGNKVGTEFQVNNYVQSIQTNSEVASFPNGNFIVVYQSVGQDGSSTGIFARIFTSEGVSLGLEFLVNTVTQGSQHSPSIAINSDGSFVITWRTKSDQLFAQRFDSSYNKVGDEFQVNSYVATIKNDPTLAFMSDKYYFETWGIKANGSYAVVGKLFDPEALTIVDEFQVSEHIVSNIPNPRTVCGDNYQCFTVWRGKNGSNHEIYISKHDFSPVIGALGE
ncbi:MAG: hypothetical protein HRU36_01375 [Rickettsiales bacterium]|nr:hypothetical protein [Rickettsiales bacterium]